MHPRTSTSRRTLLIALLVAGLGLLRPAAAAGEELLVFAAASLSEAFGELGRDFEARHPGTRVVCNFAGSQVLATQIERGAEADLIAAANAEVLAPLQRRREIEPPVFFAGNELILIVSRGSSAALPDFRAVAGAGKLLAIGSPQVPVGAYTRLLLDDLSRDPAYGADFVAAFARNVVSEETSVRAIAAKVALGEVDAGIVYRTDLTPKLKDKVVARPLPAGRLPQIRYPIALLRRSHHRQTAARFLDHLFSPVGREILSRHGFTPGDRVDEPTR